MASEGKEMDSTRKCKYSRFYIFDDVLYFQGKSNIVEDTETVTIEDDCSDEEDGYMLVDDLEKIQVHTVLENVNMKCNLLRKDQVMEKDCVNQ